MDMMDVLYSNLGCKIFKPLSEFGQLNRAQVWLSMAVIRLKFSFGVFEMEYFTWGGGQKAPLMRT
jgi:hypothetical protein